MYNGNPQTVINMSDVVQDADGKTNKDTLFGPSIGVVNGGPEWADIKEKESIGDDLTLEIVKGWVAKSKEASLIHSIPRRVNLVLESFFLLANVLHSSRPLNLDRT